MTEIHEKFEELTQRQQEIIRILAQFTTENPATVADISKELRISTRTVLREMTLLEQWLGKQGMKLFRKPGVGMAIEATEAQRKLLSAHRGGESVVSARPERRRDLMAQLLTANEPIKAFVFTKTYQISDGTLGADLDYVAQILTTHSVTLHRKSGVGLYVTGTELHLRHAMAAVVFDWMQDEAVASLFLWRKQTPVQTKRFGLWHLIDSQYLPQIHQSIISVAQTHGITYTDRGYLSLMVFVSIALKRMTQGHTLTQAPPQAERTLATDMAHALDMATWTEEEIGYLAVELAGDVQPTQEDGDAWGDTIGVRRLMLKLVSQVNQTLGGTLEQDELLLSDLVRHTQAAVKRLKLGMAAKNNHGPDIRASYPNVYQATAEGCAVLEDPLDIHPIPESEIALIAMHFCAAVERAKDNLRPLQVVIACPMGMGMSRILAANLTKAYPNMRIKDVVSVMALEKTKLEEQAVDLVVSTVMIDLDFPSICVSPTLLPQDKIRLTEVCNRISATPEKKSKESAYGHTLLETIDYVRDLGHGIARLLTYVPLLEVGAVKNKERLLQYAAELFPEGDATQLFQDLTAREDISETYIDQGQTLLLHCKTTGIDTCRFGYIRLAQPLTNGDNQVLGAIVMVAPREGSQIHVEMMGHICSAFLNNESLYLAAQQGTQQELANQIQEILGSFYTNTLHLI